MNRETYYWKWKSTIIDFKTLSDAKTDNVGYITKKDMVFTYLGTPDEKIHEWYNGGYSSEYNEAFRYAKELGLIEEYIDYDEIRYQNIEKDKEIERLNKENNDLRKLYQRTYKHLFDIGNDELARYFQAQIDECSTFYIEPIIDYYEEYKRSNNIINKIKQRVLDEGKPLPSAKEIIDIVGVDKE